MTEFFDFILGPCTTDDSGNRNVYNSFRFMHLFTINAGIIIFYKYLL